VSTGHNSGPLNLLSVEPKRERIWIGERSHTNREMSGKSLRRDDDISGLCAIVRLRPVAIGLVSQSC